MNNEISLLIEQISELQPSLHLREIISLRKRVYEKDPTNYENALELIRVLHLSDLRSALDILLDSLGRAQQSIEPAFNLKLRITYAEVLIHHGQYDESRIILDDAIKDHPHNLWPVLSLAKLESTLGNHKLGLSIITNAAQFFWGGAHQAMHFLRSMQRYLRAAILPSIGLLCLQWPASQFIMFYWPTS